MLWRLRFHPAVRKDLRRLPQAEARFIVSELLPRLGVNPFGGEPLHGPLRDFWKYRSGEYRIAYLLDKAQSEIVVLEIGPRGGFYERLRRRLGR